MLLVTAVVALYIVTSRSLTIDEVQGNVHVLWAPDPFDLIGALVFLVAYFVICIIIVNLIHRL